MKEAEVLEVTEVNSEGIEVRDVKNKKNHSMCLDFYDLPILSCSVHTNIVHSSSWPLKRNEKLKIVAFFLGFLKCFNILLRWPYQCFSLSTPEWKQEL